MNLTPEQEAVLQGLSRKQLECLVVACGITTHVRLEETKAARSDIRERLESGRLAFIDVENVSRFER